MVVWVGVVDMCRVVAVLKPCVSVCTYIGRCVMKLQINTKEWKAQVRCARRGAINLFDD